MSGESENILLLMKNDIERTMIAVALRPLGFSVHISTEWQEGLNTAISITDSGRSLELVIIDGSATWFPFKSFELAMRGKGIKAHFVILVSAKTDEEIAAMNTRHDIRFISSIRAAENLKDIIMSIKPEVESFENRFVKTPIMQHLHQ